mgnify:CR=1 FL=1
MENLPSAVEKVYRLHMLSLGTEVRKEHEGQIEKVEWNEAEQVYNVYFKNGNWWHYDTINNTWY